MAEPSLSPLAHSKASPNRISAPAFPGGMRVPETSVAGVVLPSTHPVDAEVKSVQVLEDGCAAEQDERETDEPGEGPQAAECKAEKPDACGDGSCGGIRRHAVKMGEERLERGEIEMPAREHQRPGGANHEGAQARQTERHPHGARHRQCHSHWDLNHSPSSPPISRGRSPGEVGRSSAEGP